MDEFFCKTRLFWAITRIIFSILTLIDIFAKIGDNYRYTAIESIYNFLFFIYAVLLFIIGINEIREKETNTSLLFITGITSMIFSVLIVALTMNHLKSGYFLLLFLNFAWMILVGLKDILGNHFYVEE
ncbi:hypothetical protein E0I26_04385 [Flavobacterium rhamnosiphilum]|uniref:Uncharacterized protein n=1 Tax=Flavobacterium rhamnosiphilum TaxID=2541724 RepID=A0A4R5FAR0_9FLAO|nr:hypothetical protein [Flavobacterium rhamnosiphilum]TDE45931.1 hypothetical protein E0I26_04385 [Flavobacterium rhamnosiphilum]